MTRASKVLIYFKSKILIATDLVYTGETFIIDIVYCRCEELILVFCGVCSIIIENMFVKYDVRVIWLLNRIILCLITLVSNLRSI